jgi:hypothetical protein
MEFAAGNSSRSIARELNAEGVPGPRLRSWGDTTIRGHALRRTGSHAGIVDRDNEGPVGRRAVDRYIPDIGELDRVPDEVEENLRV